MAVTNLKQRKSYAWIPPQDTAAWKITVESGGVEEDITNDITSFKMSDGVTEVVGDFEFNVLDPDERFKNKWTGNEVVRYYSDYAADATTLRFKGIIEKPSNQGNRLRVKGRSRSSILLSRLVTKEYNSSNASDVVKDLVESYGESFNTDNIESVTTPITTTWFEKPFWECIQEVCDSADADCYVDADDSFHFFKVGSRKNTGEAVVHESNLFEVLDFYPDVTQVKNRIKVYGSEEEGTSILYTAEDIKSQTRNFVREEFSRDDNITKQIHAKNIAEAKLRKKKDPPQVGVVECMLLASIQPGEKVRISAPGDNMTPRFYDVLSFEHIIDYEGEIMTKLHINKEPRTTSVVLRDITRRQNQSTTSPVNPQQLKFSTNELFNEDTGSYDSSEMIIDNGKLRLAAAVPQSTWISDTVSADSNVTKAYLVTNGESLDGATFEVSNNGGTSYKSISKNQSVTFEESGKSLRLRITISNEDTRIDSYAIQYS